MTEPRFATEDLPGRPTICVEDRCVRWKSSGRMRGIDREGEGEGRSLPGPARNGNFATMRFDQRLCNGKTENRASAMRPRSWSAR